jgi:hypothetical protein
VRIINGSSELCAVMPKIATTSIVSDAQHSS